ncbi:hypothetical protein Hanom_Chr00s053407g01781091 [Helianthus anomalus]
MRLSIVIEPPRTQKPLLTVSNIQSPSVGHQGFCTPRLRIFQLLWSYITTCVGI